MTDTAGLPPDPEENKELVLSTLDFPVVGIGASAGGLPALASFFEQVPEDSGMAFVVILHLSPTYDSKLNQILQRAARIPVRKVVETTRIKANHIYVISPNINLSMDDNHLIASTLIRPLGRHVAIDLFFRTLAQVHRERAVCIVLSGNGSDGAVGLTRVKEQGGIAFAQSPVEAEFDAMPKNAIATGMIDFVLPVAEMPLKLIDLWQNARAIELPAAAALTLQTKVPDSTERSALTEQAMLDIMTLLRTRTGHDFRHYKRATVLRRIERRLQVNGLPDLLAYRDYLQDSSEETPALLKDMLISVTNFFRDSEAFEALDSAVVKQIFEGRPPTEQVRVWVAGCATGEEAYSVSMLMLEQLKLMETPPELQIFATDIDNHAISVGRLGLYPQSVVTDVSPTRLREFFSKDNAHYRVKKIVRESVLFAAHNILRDPPFSNLDLVCCRNLMIYLDREVQIKVLEMLHFALRPGGYLFLGTSESAEVGSDLFTAIDKKNRIFRARPVSRSNRVVPTLPLGSPLSGNARTPESAPPKRQLSFAELHQQLLEQYAPPSALVDRHHEIVHLTDRAGQFLRYAGGVPSHNLLSLIHPELRLELQAAMFQAVQTGKSVEARRVKMQRDDRSFYVNMTARPVRDADRNADFIVVLFDEVEDSTGAYVDPADLDGRGLVIARLEEELREVKQQLQLTIEQSETATEELKASNEELQAINEELRSATEELETSREELQSINEELITVNYELKVKIEETGKVNDDLQNLVASTDIATVFIDSGLRIMRYTPRATEIFNIIASDTGRSLLDITHRLDYVQLADDATEAFRSLRLIEREVHSSDGKWYIARMLPYRTTEDRIAGAVMTFIDITGRRRAEEALRQGEERMRLVAESTMDYAIVTMDEAGKINSWNTGAQKIFGYAEAEATGRYFSFIFVPEDRERGAPETELTKARTDGSAEDERWHMRKDGSTFYCSGITTLLEGGMGFAKIARDLTGRKLLEASREELLKKEKAASDLKDELLAVMSHELKHPLNLIHVNAELLMRLPEVRDMPVVVRATDTIRRTVLNQAQIIDDLLDLSRVRMGKLSLVRTGVPWAVVIEDILSVVRTEADAKGVALIFDAGDQPLMVFVDSARLEQIVWNLLSNAIKFTRRGDTITVMLSRDGDFGKLEVIDTGQGIAPEFIDQVFDMFRQGTSRPTTRKDGGLGIGCALVRQLADAHGGRAQVSSEGIGRGACFTVWLPLYAHLQSQPDHESPGNGSLSGRKVLLVDDTTETLDAFGELLKTDGARLTTASSAREALTLAANDDFDLVVSDIAMPEMDGYEFISALRQHEKLRRVPAIAVTGFGRPQDVQRAMAAGFDAHVTKPVSLDAITHAVRGLFAKDLSE